MKTYLLPVCLSFMLGSLASNLSCQEVTQPLGTLVRVWDTSGLPPFPLQHPSRIPPFTPPSTPIAEVNYICAQWDFSITPSTVPFDERHSATEIILTQPQHFVRVYAPEAGSGPNGAWMMRSEYVRGLTPEEIKDRFALPSLPTHIVNVDLSPSQDPNGKDYALWTGIAGPIQGFGNGGGVQNRVIADFNGTNYFPNYTFFIGTRDHPQPIGPVALSYAPMAGSGNTLKVAEYLDSILPEAYTDLENVYTALDYLNWIDNGPEPIQNALTQLGPQNFSAVPFVIERNTLLFSESILDHLYSCGGCTPQFNLELIGENLRLRKLTYESKFHNWTSGIVGTLSTPFNRNIVIGMSLTEMNSGLKWRNNRGHARIRSTKVGFFSHFCDLSLFSDVLFTLGTDHIKTKRHIDFANISRRANSRHRGYDFSAHWQLGYDNYWSGWQITPLAKISYFYIHHSSFTEHGADSLNLRVSPNHFQTLRTELGFSFGSPFNFFCAIFKPHIYLAWVHNSDFRHKAIKSRLNDISQTFNVNSTRFRGNAFLGRASLSFGFMPGMTLEAAYEVETSREFFAQNGEINLNFVF